MPLLFQLELLEIPNNLLTGLNLLFGPFLLLSPVPLTPIVGKKFLPVHISLFHFIPPLFRRVQLMVLCIRVIVRLIIWLFPIFLL